MTTWTFARYVRAVLGGDSVEDLARHVAESLPGPDTVGTMTLEQAQATVLATVASSEGEAGDRVRGSRMLAFSAWREAGFQARLVGEIMAYARAFADEGKCPECGRFGAHEGVCAGPARG